MRHDETYLAVARDRGNRYCISDSSTQIDSLTQRNRTMAIKEQGVWPCTITSANFGENDKNVPQVQINGRIDDGPSKGQMFTYEETVDVRSGPYVGRSCKAVGWAGKTLNSLHGDCLAWITKTGGKSTVEIQHLEMKKGKAYDKWVEGGCNGPQPLWDKAKSIGKGAKPLKAASQQSLADADEAMRMAMSEDGGAPPDDAPPAGKQDDIPFITSSMTSEPSSIAKVIR